jgi:hypothetical protein
MQNMEKHKADLVGGGGAPVGKTKQGTPSGINGRL